MFLSEKETSAKAPAEPSLEKAVERLEEIVSQLESGEADLEMSIELFQEGKKLGSGALRRLDKLERRVRLVVGSDGEELTTRDFDGEPDE